MNPQNSYVNSNKTVPAEYVPPMSLHRFCQITGLSQASAWRYEKRGWLRTHLIANRRYVLAADVAEFNRRLASDKFAGSVSNLSAVRQIKPKNKANEYCWSYGHWRVPEDWNESFDLRCLEGRRFHRVCPAITCFPFDEDVGMRSH
jgi:hypothetical protein